MVSVDLLSAVVLHALFDTSQWGVEVYMGPGIV
jgi:hypothetical protein